MAKLPDWIQDCRDFCDSYLTEPYPRANGADYWHQHGSDLVQKIEQQMVRIAELEGALRPFAEAYTARSDEARYVLIHAGLGLDDWRAAAAAMEDK